MATGLQVLVTGGSGFLGRGIVKALLERKPGWSTYILDIVPPKADISSRIAGFLKVDITSFESVATAFENITPRFDLVIHTAGLVPARDLRYSTNEVQWQKVKAVNVDGTRNLVNAAMATGCMHFVYTSSCAAVGDDLDHDYYNMDETAPLGVATLHYGKSKDMAERYVLSAELAEKGLTACALRPSTIIGPGDTAVIAIMHDLIAKGETYFIVGDGYNIYDIMYLDNAVDAHLLAAENLLDTRTAAGHAFFISNDEPVYFWDFLAAIWAQFGHVPAYRVRIPTGLAWLVGFLLEWITWLTGTASTMSRGSVRDGVRTQYANTEKTRTVLGYVPKVRLSEGVRRTCDDYKKYLARQAESQKSK